MVNIQRKGSKTYRDLILSVVENLRLEGDLKGAKKILIKPNFVTKKTSSEGVTVDLNLIKHLVEVINDISDAEIVVGETSLINTGEVFRYLSVYELEKSGCRVENFEKNEWVLVEPPYSLLFKNFLIPKTAYESDLIINVSKMKTHELTGVTLGIKNFFGLLSRGGRKYAHLNDINKGIVDVYSYFERNKKVISIIDGLTALSGKSGPILGTPINMDCVVSSTNTLRGDAAASVMMGADPFQIEHLKLASKVLKVGIDGDGLKENDSGIKFDLPLMPEEKGFKVNEWLYDKFYKYPVQKDSELCISCLRCESICPKDIVTIENNFFSHNSAECIHCLCCVEACNTGAITYKIKNKALFLLLKQGWSAYKTSKQIINKLSFKGAVI